MAEAKKTDLERFVALYDSVGIKCKIEKGEEGWQFIRLFVNPCLKDPGRTAVEGFEGSTSSEKIDGYEYFYTDLVFDKEGKFILQEIRE